MKLSEELIEGLCGLGMNECGYSSKQFACGVLCNPTACDPSLFEEFIAFMVEELFYIFLNMRYIVLVIGIDEPRYFME